MSERKWAESNVILLCNLITSYAAELPPRSKNIALQEPWITQSRRSASPRYGAILKTVS